MSTLSYQKVTVPNIARIGHVHHSGLLGVQRTIEQSLIHPSMCRFVDADLGVLHPEIGVGFDGDPSVQLRCDDLIGSKLHELVERVDMLFGEPLEPVQGFNELIFGLGVSEWICGIGRR